MADGADAVGLVVEPPCRELAAELACGVGFDALSGGPFTGLPALACTNGDGQGRDRAA